jgi:hypothetical protein
VHVVQETHHHQQQQQQQGSAAGAGGRHEDMAELQRLAYSSLAKSVVQIILEDDNLGAEYHEILLQLAGELVVAAENDAAPHPSSSSSSRAKWSLAASLAAAAAAGAYRNHVYPPCKDSSSSSSGSGSSSTSYAPAGDADYGPASPTAVVGQGTCEGPLACKVCLHASGLFAALCSLERGAALPALSWAAALAVGAQRRGMLLQHWLEHQLMAVAWRHPVPYVCGNVLCGRLKGASAVGAVRGPAGTLCGGCREVWYCCEGCQQEASGNHEKVCGRLDLVE